MLRRYYQQTALTNGFLTSCVLPRRGPLRILNLFGLLLWQAQPRPRPRVLMRLEPWGQPQSAHRWRLRWLVEARFFLGMSLPP